jgi:hypothetical protein
MKVYRPLKKKTVLASTPDKHTITHYRMLFAKNLIAQNLTTRYPKLLDAL